MASNVELSEKAGLVTGIAGWMCCSLGMLIFNKLAIMSFPVECFLVALQMGVSVVCMLFCWNSLHIGSFKDVLRWSMVTPFYTGMLLTSILALKHAPMSLVICFRAVSPMVSLAIERFYPNPLRVTTKMFGCLLVTMLGMGMYAHAMDLEDTKGVAWVMLNSFFAIGDRLLQRMMLAKDQSPVDISKTGVTLLNNLLGMIPLCVVGILMREYEEVPAALAHLTTMGTVWVIGSCAVGVGISYMGIWVQALIPATSFLVLVNANKFVIIFFEVFVMHTKFLLPIQIAGASVTILASVAYGLAREEAEADVKKGETLPLVSNAKA